MGAAASVEPDSTDTELVEPRALPFSIASSVADDEFTSSGADAIAVLFLLVFQQEE